MDDCWLEALVSLVLLVALVLLKMLVSLTSNFFFVPLEWSCESDFCF